MVKRLHGGFAASNGGAAAKLAEQGVTAAADVIDGDYGYGRTFAADADALQFDVLDDELEWAITEREVKPCAAWGGSHVGIDEIAGEAGGGRRAHLDGRRGLELPVPPARDPEPVVVDGSSVQPAIPHRCGRLPRLTLV